MGRIGRLLTRVGATSVSCAVILALLSAGGSGVGTADNMHSQSRYVGASVYAAVDSTDTNAGGIYMIGGRSGNDINATSTGQSSVTRISVGQEALPWNVHVTYSLDGPQTDAATINGARGLVGVHVTVTRNELASADIATVADSLVPVLTFTIPTDAGNDLTASDGVAITQHGSDTVIAAVGNTVIGNTASDDSVGAHTSESTAAADIANVITAHAATVLDLGVYLNATRFSMSPIVLAAVPASDADSLNAQINDLTAGATTLANDITGAGNHQYDDLIAQLTTLRDRERALAESTIRDRSAAHKRAFDAYMAAYVGSYTTHLRGSISTKTQMSALIGTAGELSGDTPLAQAVVDLANAVNALSATHRHTGAADEVDTIIRRIRQQGVNGLADELKQAAGHESQLGSSGYSAGQSQLSQAMIPYSMAYTDTYTEHLSELTGGTSSGAAAYQTQAIEETNASFRSDDDLRADQANVDAAMAALATASEHTGRAQAIERLLLRFEDQFETPDAGSDSMEDGSGHNGTAQDGTSQDGNPLHALIESGTPEMGVGGNGIAAVVEAARLKRLHERREQAAEDARQRSDDNDGNAQGASLVDDRISMSKDDVMSFAGSVGSIGGGGNDSSNGSSSGESNQDVTNADDAISMIDTPSVAFGMVGLTGMHTPPVIAAASSTGVNEIVTIDDGAGLLAVAAPSLRSSVGDVQKSARSSTDDAATSRFLLVYRTLS